HVKESGRHGQYAICVIEAGPADRGEGFVWQDKIFGGSIPQNFRPSVQKGIVDTMAKGVVAGYPMEDIRVALLDGKFHTVDSSDMAFQIAGSLAIRKAAVDASPVLLEPIMDVEVRVDRKSTRLNSSHRTISYAAFCLKKKKKTKNNIPICLRSRPYS